jgi:hypothetical protein
MRINQSLLPKSVYWLLAANAVPLLGVLFLDWSTFSIVFIYWCENVVIGAINILKMITSCPDSEALSLGKAKLGVSEAQYKKMSDQIEAHKGLLGPAHHAAKLFCVPFFTFHYGMFCFVHGVFVVALLGDGGLMGGGRGGGGNPFDLLNSSLKTLGQQHLVWAVLALAGSHLLSFCINYLGKGEYRRTTLPMLMIQPYGRIVVLHLAIIFGAFATMALGSSVLLLLILVAGKTILDLKLHLRERKKNGSILEPTAAGVA